MRIFETVNPDEAEIFSRGEGKPELVVNADVQHTA
jgi:hypothetical protein